MSRDITVCHPELQQKAALLIAECKKAGLNIGIGECYRTPSEQNALYAQGRTKPGAIVTNVKYPDSMHCWGVAFDFFRNDGKGAYYDNDGFFTKVGRIGEKIGLEWGGSWQGFVDKPHFQLKQWGSTPKTLKTCFGDPETFKKFWNQGDDEMVKTINLIVDGQNRKVDAINKNGFNYIKIRDIADAVGYEVGNQGSTPVLTKKKG